MVWMRRSCCAAGDVGAEGLVFSRHGRVVHGHAGALRRWRRGDRSARNGQRGGSGAFLFPAFLAAGWFSGCQDRGGGRNAQSFRETVD